MHRLFWKFFLSFWAALALFTAATLFSASHYLNWVREHRSIADPFARFVDEAASAQRAADTGGLAGLRAWALRADRRRLVPLLVVDASGRDVLGRPVPAALRDRIRRLARYWVRPAPPGRHPPAVIALPGGKRYRLIPDFQAVTLARILSRPRAMVPPLLLAALAGAVVCLLLARYLTAPLERLRRATEAYAAGDLAHRVAPTLGRRRDEIADLARSFDAMAQRLQELMTAQRRLLRDVSHELRSPLARLEAALGLARQRIGTYGVDELDRIEREAERLNELIGQVLSLARYDSAAVQPHIESVDLGELLEAVVSDADFEARSQGRCVRLELHAAAVIAGDAALLHSAIENVVRNAVRHTAAGTAVAITLRSDPGPPEGFTVEVRDHGPGVPEEELPRLFEAFVRAGQARDRATGGFGLGLAIADRAVRLHGGRIEVRNAPQGGLSVIVWLPARAAGAPPADQRPGRSG